MKRALYILLISIACIPAFGQDFVARFMQETVSDSGIVCQVISPRMMEKLMDFHHTQTDTALTCEELTVKELAKVKTMQIVTAAHNGNAHYDCATGLLEDNPHRFIPLSQEDNHEGSNAIYVRRRGALIVELVLLQLRKANGSFTVVDLIGHMDDKFLQSLRTGTDGKP